MYNLREYIVTEKNFYDKNGCCRGNTVIENRRKHLYGENAAELPLMRGNIN